MLETIRQYAQERLGDSTEGIAIRDRHRDYYTTMAVAMDTPANSGLEPLLDRAETDIDNLRAAFASSRENSDTDNALRLAASLQPVWLARGRAKEGSDWLDLGLADPKHRASM